MAFSSKSCPISKSSIGKIASLPYTIKNGVFFVVLCLAVLYANNTDAICLSHSFSFSETFAKLSHNVLLNRSTNPFVSGWYGDDNLCLTLNLSHSPSTNLFLKCAPLSDKIIFEHPCLQITFL